MQSAAKERDVFFRTRHVAAASALVWSPVEPIWAYVVSSWRRLFTQRAGAGGGFELRTAPLQHLGLMLFFEVVRKP